MNFADIHMHALYGLDDGPDTKQDMFSLIDKAYLDGTRYLCLTPHMHKGFFKSSLKDYEIAFQKLSEYVEKTYPDLKIFQGNELRYSENSVSWLDEGFCKTLNHTRFVLVDFTEWERAKNITKGLYTLLNAGYIPILAHAERYGDLHWRFKELREYKSNGILIQVDTQSLFRGFGLRVQERAKGIIREGLADFVSSDAHDTKKRPPELSGAYNYIAKKFDASYAEDLCLNNARMLLLNE